MKVLDHSNFLTTFNKMKIIQKKRKISNNNEKKIINTNLIKNNKKIKTLKSFNNFYKIENIFGLNENEIINNFDNIIRILLFNNKK